MIYIIQHVSDPESSNMIDGQKNNKNLPKLVTNREVSNPVFTLRKKSYNKMTTFCY